VVENELDLVEVKAAAVLVDEFEVDVKVEDPEFALLVLAATLVLESPAEEEEVVVVAVAAGGEEGVEPAEDAVVEGSDEVPVVSGVREELDEDGIRS
jgi:hypothetical protein